MYILQKNQQKQNKPLLKIHKSQFLIGSFYFPSLFLMIYLKLQQNLNISKSLLMSDYFKTSLQFICYSTLLYACYITSGLYHQKILKQPYKQHNTQEQQLFTYPIVYTLFPPLVAAVIGYFYRVCQQEDNQQKKHIPLQKTIICGIVINFNMWTYNQAIILSSFTAAIMAKSCSLLSVIIVAVFFSRVKEKSLKLESNKVWIGAIACAGLFCFNYFKDNKANDQKPLTILGLIFLLASLIGDGFLPDLQAEIKSLYKPSAMDMYYHINLSTFLIAFAYSICSLQFIDIFIFLRDYQSICWDLLYLSFLNAIGQLVIYQMIKSFKQHVPSFVIATRKCFTVIVNILYFNHNINALQIVGIVIVFFAIMLQVYDNYQLKFREGINNDSSPQHESIKSQENEHGIDLSQNIRQIQFQKI